MVLLSVLYEAELVFFFSLLCFVALCMVHFIYDMYELLSSVVMISLFFLRAVVGSLR